MNQDIPNNRSGLLAGGNWIIDQVKMIDVYPKHEQLANIFDQSQGTGGSPYNVLLDLAKMEKGEFIFNNEFFNMREIILKGIQ